jgi:hypothetical protein
VLEDPPRNAAEQRRRDGAAAARADDDQIGLLRIRKRDNRVDRVAGDALERVGDVRLLSGVGRALGAVSDSSIASRWATGMVPPRPPTNFSGGTSSRLRARETAKAGPLLALEEFSHGPGHDDVLGRSGM